ncbi:18822_t:CDS:1, partial [Gigaspora margarita]
LPKGERYKFSAEQINFIKEQRDHYNKSFAEIRDDLNKDPNLSVKATPNRVKNAYHNATKKQLREKLLGLQISNLL